METTKKRILNTTGAKTPKGKDYEYVETETIQMFGQTTTYNFYYKNEELVESKMEWY